MGRYVKFDQTGYLTAVKKAILSELQHLVPYFENNLRTSFGSVMLRSIDEKYKSAMLSSIDSMAMQRANSFVLTSGAGGEVNGQNQAFRAVYYEYGTGNQMEPPSHWSQGAGGWGGWNMARRGKDIYQRERGMWTDLGGNEHRSRVRGKPTMLPNKKGTYGEEILASHWFRDAMNISLSMLDEAVHRAVRSVPIATYIDIRSITKRM